MCHFLHRQLKVRLFSQAADLSLLPAWNGRLAPLQRPSQGILSTTASTKRTQTLQTAWTSFWPDSSLGKVWSDIWLPIQNKRTKDGKRKWNDRLSLFPLLVISLHAHISLFLTSILLQPAFIHAVFQSHHLAFPTSLWPPLFIFPRLLLP